MQAKGLIGKEAAVTYQPGKGDVQSFCGLDDVHVFVLIDQ